ncbi:HEPN domain-containing protein [Pseudomonas sp. GL-R-19]|uniref:HEPN domain-containing protein n=1 Tax=Pseudomonas sp. GL-R-19 TaxID=2832391 RepID=UPI001CBD7621|nr:HEPN domain-containing protein [Pseudomonas sp. GL-R-19]
MNNREVESFIQACADELEGIRAFIVGNGEEARPTPYLKRYAVMRATGCIEVGFKQIIADRVDQDSQSHVKNFIKRKVRDSSMNPKLGAIENMLSEFDDRWRGRFDELIAFADKPKLKGALTCLVDARNEFAHGGSPNLDISNIIQNFNDSIDVLKALDNCVSYDYEQA